MTNDQYKPAVNAERALQASELRYRRLFETAKDGILLLDFESGKILDANPFLCTLLGYTAAELLGKHLWEISPFQNIAASQAAFLELQKKEYIRYEHLPLQTLDGRHVDVEFVSNVYQEHGKIIQCNIRDITVRKRAEVALERSFTLLAASETRFKSLLESAPDGMIIVDADGVIRLVNSQVERLFGYAREEMLTHSVEMLMPERMHSQYQMYRARYLANTQASPMNTGLDICGLRKNRSEFPIDVSLSPLHTGNGILAIAAVRDASERKRLETIRSQLSAIVESTEDAILSKSLDGIVTSWNKGAEHLYGYTADEMIGRSASILSLADRPDEVRQLIDRIWRGESVQRYETKRVRKGGQRIDVSLTVSPMHTGTSGKIVGVSVVARDVTEQRRVAERIRHLAQHDPLTDLPNRALFRDRLEHALAQARRGRHQVAVLFIDLDHFKNINDSLGHQIGDRLLDLTAERLRHCLREGDTIARLGGDEFVVSLSVDADGAVASSIANKILMELREPYVVDTHELHVSGSIGISLYPVDGNDVETLMRAADTAMYHAKENGRDSFQFFMPQLNDAAQRRHLIAGRLHQALKRGELMLYYQPQVDLATGKIYAAEALIRWRQSDMGPVDATEIIEVAEHTGLIDAIGEWVLREGCRQVRQWRETGYPDFRIAINISPHQFRGELATMVGQALKEFGLSPSALEAEITESSLMLQGTENRSVLEQLAGLGVRLAVDDFGTGYSNLAYLQRFPVYTLKIDQSFVRKIDSDEHDGTLVSAIITLARSLHLNVVAEGVETSEQAAFLKSHGCGAAQGFHFSEAVPADAFFELLRTNNAGAFPAREEPVSSLAR